MSNMKKYLFIAAWFILAVVLVIISQRYKSRVEALVAVVESQMAAISFQKPVIIERLPVIPGQEVKKGDTLVVVSRPDLNLDIERKTNELQNVISGMRSAVKNFESKVELLALERDAKINRLTAELNELKTELNQQKMIQKRLNTATGEMVTDSLRLIELNAILDEIRDLKQYYLKEKQRQQLLLDEKLAVSSKEQELLERELQALHEEKSSLVRIARFEGIVGTLDVQMDELVPPFKSILAVFEARPSIIKAYMNERYAAPVIPGDQVEIVSENRLYSINGEVKELGARITAYPGKIQDPNASAPRYGQEIFISIPRDNNFLTGEKVFVYPVNTDNAP